jgi:hypothetical protein
MENKRVNYYPSLSSLPSLPNVENFSASTGRSKAKVKPVDPPVIGSKRVSYIDSAQEKVKPFMNAA